MFANCVENSSHQVFVLCEAASFKEVWSVGELLAGVA
jgi:hypothetical protein